MSRGNPLITALFWLMFLIGGGSLAIGLYLPPWLENRTLHDRLTAAQQGVAALEARLTALDMQIEHLKTDPAYVERLARKEFGIITPGRETVLIESLDGPQDAAPVSDAKPAGTQAQIEAAVQTAAQTHPFFSLYMRDTTRPIVMGMSLALVFAALALLGRSTLSSEVATSSVTQ